MKTWIMRERRIGSYLIGITLEGNEEYGVIELVTEAKKLYVTKRLEEPDTVVLHPYLAPALADEVRSVAGMEGIDLDTRVTRLLGLELIWNEKMLKSEDGPVVMVTRRLEKVEVQDAAPIHS